MTSAREADEAMTAESFIAWSERQTHGRFELLDGIVYVMSSEQAIHARVKRRIANKLDQAIADKGLPCEVFGDGMAVRVDGDNVFEPDALVLCGTPIDDKVILVDKPLIVVEVGSPSTQRIDATVKLARYFRNPHIFHYLIVIPTTRSVVHHRRTPTNEIATTSQDDGVIVLDPPGLELSVTDLFPPPQSGETAVGFTPAS